MSEDQSIDTLMESTFGEMVPWDDYPQNDAGMNPLGTYSTPWASINDRHDGKFPPFYECESDLARHLGIVRRFIGLSELSEAVMTALRVYVWGAGVEISVHQAVKTECPPELVDAVRRIVEKFSEDNSLVNSLDHEIDTRSRCDGEAIVPIERVGNRIIASPVETVQLTEPANSSGLTEYIASQYGVDCDSFDPSWRFGVLTTKRNTSMPLGYHVIYDTTGHDWDFYPPEQMLHVKRNVHRVAKRGISDWLCPAQTMIQHFKLKRNISTGEALRAAIAWVEQLPPGTSAGQAASIGGPGVGRPMRTANGENIQPRVKTYREGTMLRLTNGLQYQAFLNGQGQSKGFTEVGDWLAGFIGTRWLITRPMITGDASAVNFACHDDQTEALTLRGWVRHNDLREDDSVATFNTDTERLEYQVPMAIHRHEYDGQMVGIRSKQLNMMITPNHRMIVTQQISERVGGRAGKITRTGRRYPWRSEMASDLSRRSAWLIPTSVKATRAKRGANPQTPFLLPRLLSRCNGSNKHIRQDRLLPMRAWLEWLGYWIAEGHVSTQHQKYEVGLSQNVGPIAARMEELSTVLGFHINTHFREMYTGNTRMSLRISDKGLHKWLSENGGIGSHNKRIPEFVFKLPEILKRIVLKAMIEGDGSDRANGSFIYFTSSSQLADDTLRLAFECGYSASILKTMKHGVIPISIRNTHGLRKHFRINTKTQLRTAHYRGIVWCCTVPNGTMVTRRCGKIAITGNSSLTAEAPFVKAREADQQFYGGALKSLLWKVVRYAWKLGWLDMRGMPIDRLEKLIDIKVDFTSPATRDRAALVQQLATEVSVLGTSKRTAQVELGRDPDEEVAAGGSLDDSSSENDQPPGTPGEMSSLSARQFDRNTRAIRKVLDQFIADGNRVLAKGMLTAIGVADAKAEAYLVDAADGKIDTAELAESMLLEAVTERASDGRFGSVAGVHSRKMPADHPALLKAKAWDAAHGQNTPSSTVHDVTPTGYGPGHATEPSPDKHQTTEEQSLRRGVAEGKTILRQTPGDKATATRGSITHDRPAEQSVGVKDIDAAVDRRLSFNPALAGKVSLKVDGKTSTKQMRTVGFWTVAAQDAPHGGKVFVDQSGKVFVGDGASGKSLTPKVRPATDKEASDIRAFVAKDVHQNVLDGHAMRNKHEQQASNMAEQISSLGLNARISRPDDSNSRYVFAEMPGGGEYKIRFADHGQPMGVTPGGGWGPVGGFDTKVGKRHTASDFSVDPESGHGSSDQAFASLVHRLKTSGKGSLHESVDVESEEQPLTSTESSAVSAALESIETTDEARQVLESMRGYP